MLARLPVLTIGALVGIEGGAIKAGKEAVTVGGIVEIGLSTFGGLDGIDLVFIFLGRGAIFLISLLLIVLFCLVEALVTNPLLTLGLNPVEPALGTYLVPLRLLILLLRINEEAYTKSLPYWIVTSALDLREIDFLDFFTIFIYCNE